VVLIVAQLYHCETSKFIAAFTMASSKQEFPFLPPNPALLLQLFALDHSARFPIVKLMSNQQVLTVTVVAVAG